MRRSVTFSFEDWLAELDEYLKRHYKFGLRLMPKIDYEYCYEHGWTVEYAGEKIASLTAS